MLLFRSGFIEPLLIRSSWKVSEPENTFIAAPTSRPGNESDEPEPEPEAASTSHRVKYPRVDYNDGKDSEVDKDDYVYADDVVE